MKRTARVLEWVVIGLMATVSAVGTLFVTGYAVEDRGAPQGIAAFLAMALSIVGLSLVARFVPSVGAWVLGALCLLAVALPLWGEFAFDSYRAFLDSVGPVFAIALLVLMVPLAVLGLAHPAIAGTLLTGTAVASYAIFVSTVSGEPWLGLGASLTTSSTMLVAPMVIGGLALVVAALLIHSELTHHPGQAVPSA